MKQANSLNCFVCGLANQIGLKLKFYETAPGEVSCEYTVPEQYQGYPGIVHGGIVAAMLDEVCSRVYIRGNPPRFMYTARLEIRYRKNVPTGTQLQIIGKAEKSKSRTATSTGTIYDPEGNVLAEANALLVEIPEELIASSDLEALGWMVYDD